MVSRAGYTGAWVVAYSVSCSVCVCGGVQKQSMSMRATTRESDGPPTGPPLIPAEQAAHVGAREAPESAVLAQSRAAPRVLGPGRRLSAGCPAG